MHSLAANHSCDFSVRDALPPDKLHKVIILKACDISFILWNSMKLGIIYFSTVSLYYHDGKKKKKWKSRGCCASQIKPAWVLSEI